MRHIDNWIGDYGVITDIRWGIMRSRRHTQPSARSWSAAPSLKDFLSRPGNEGKARFGTRPHYYLAIVKSYVYNK